MAAPPLPLLLAAPVLAIQQSRGVRTVVVACPHCSGRHTHGWLPDDDEPGVRVSHCAAARPYRIVLVGPAG